MLGPNPPGLSSKKRPLDFHEIRLVGFATTHLDSEEGVATGVAWLLDIDVDTPGYSKMSHGGSS